MANFRPKSRIELFEKGTQCVNIVPRIAKCIARDTEHCSSVQDILGLQPNFSTRREKRNRVSRNSIVPRTNVWVNPLIVR